MDHVALVVEARVGEEVVPAPERSGLGIIGAEDHLADACVDERSRAHRARFEGDDERATVESPAAERSGGIAQGEDLGVSGRVVREFAFVVATSEDRAGIDAYDDRANGHIVMLEGGPGFVERKAHERFDLLALHDRNLAVTQCSAGWTARSGLRRQTLDRMRRGIVA